ncbi:MAG TPA: FHA domain-containing protein [Bryobacteraceae bacterium]|nr:FHA domain-containing protein [Bryobacteraceae bacterium]
MVKAAGEAQGKISGQMIVEQLLRNMELGQFEMAYSILAPCLFSLYLHPDDYARLTGVFELIREDARRALSARLEQWNSKPGGLGRLRGAKERKAYKIACKDWTFAFFPDSEGVVPLGDVEIHSELNETPQPGYHGTKTTLLDREPGVTGSITGRAGAGRTTGVRAETRQASERVFAEIRYEDDSGPQLFLMTQNEISVGRGGDGALVNLALYSNDEVSREHLRVRRDPAQGRFFITDQSMNGTWLNGKRLARGSEEALPARAEISVAEVIRLVFEAKP